MAGAKPSNRGGGASKKPTASSDGKIVNPFTTTKRRRVVMPKKTKKGCKARLSDDSGPLDHFHLFPKLPFEVRLRIWSMVGPTPRTLAQDKLLEWNPRFTQCESAPAPAVMHACRESRIEYLYREDDAANKTEGKSHALYAPIFPDRNRNMSFFSFEVDALHLMNFKVAGTVVRNNPRTIVIGPYLRSSTPPTWATGIYLRVRIASVPSRSWFTHQSQGSDDLDMNDPYPQPLNKHTLVISKRAEKYVQVHEDREIKYEFFKLVKFPALERLVVLISREESIPEDPKQHIIWKTLKIVKDKYPSFKFPDVEFRWAY